MIFWYRAVSKYSNILKIWQRKKVKRYSVSTVAEKIVRQMFGRV